MTKDRYSELFWTHGYWPVRCPDHPDHAVNRDDHTGEMLCTSGHIVLPIVRDEEDRVGDALKGTSRCGDCASCTFEKERWG